MKRLARPLIVILAVALSIPMLESAAQAVPNPPTLLTPANNVNTSTNPIFSWSPVANATTYHIQVATASNFGNGTLVVDANTVNTNFVPTTELPQGQLFWHVNVTDNTGTSGYQVSPNQFNKTPATAPNVTAPADGAALAYPTQPLIFSWDPLPNTAYYQIEIALDQQFTSMLGGFPANTNLGSYTLLSPPTFGQSFYWRVRAFSQANQASQYSSTRTFSVTWTAKPTLVSPPNQQNPPVEDYELTWNWFAGATSYDLQVSTDINFNTLVVNANVKGTKYKSFPHLVAASYFWRVRGRTGAVAGNWSDVWTFSKAWPGAPFAATGTSSRVQLTSPADGAFTTEPTFTWTPFRKAAYYEVQMSGDPTFTTYFNCVTNHPEVTANPGCLDQLQPDGLYYWRVRPVDAPGGVQGLFSPLNGFGSPYSFVWRPARVPQVSPANGASVDSPVLTWTHVPGGRYHVTVQRTVDSSVVATVDTYNTSFVPNVPYDAVTPANNSFRWYVQSYNMSGLTAAADPSTWRTYTLLAPSGGGPNPNPIGSPQNGTITPLLQWNRVPGAAYYNLFWQNGGFQLLAGSLTQPGYAHPSQDIPLGTFAWKVEARDASNVLLSTSSFNGSFTINVFPTVTGQTAPAHCSAVNTCNTLLDTPIFEWTDVPGTTLYNIIFATDPNFTNITGTFQLYNPRYTPTTSYADSQAGQATYWYVKACQANHCGFGPEVYSGSHPPISAFRKQSTGVNSTGPGLLMPDPQNPPANPPTAADQITFSWEDYLTTNTTQPCVPVDPPVTICPTQEASYYLLEVSDLADFSHVIDAPAVDDNSYTASDRTYPEGPLFWRVRAVDNTGNLLTWSTPRMLVKKSTALTLTAPAVDASLTQLPVFQWNAQDFAAQYQIEIYKNPNQPLSGGNLVLQATTSMTAWAQTTAMPPGQYGWRMRRLDASGNPGPWTATDNTTLRKFTYTGPATTLVSPADGAVLGNNSILFQWQTVPGATSYQIQTSLQSNFGALYENVPTVSTAYAPQNIYPDGQYYWRVLTLDVNGQTLATSPSRGFIRGIAPLSAPQNVQATAGDSVATVSWTPPAFDGGFSIKSYTVTSSPGNSSCTVNAPATQCLVQFLANGTSYTFTVKATNNANPNVVGPASAPSNAVTPTAGIGAPTNVTATAGDATASISWVAPLNNGGFPLASYTVTASPGGATCTVSHPTLTCNINGLTNGQSYTFTVKAKNTNNVVGPASAASSPVTPSTADFFHALNPSRILDSRPNGPPLQFNTPWHEGESRDVQVTGNGGVPASADAVVLNVTVTSATKSSFLTIWPAGTVKPVASSLNFVAGQTIPNSVTVKLGGSGRISIYNPGGNVDVIADVVGYYDGNAGDGFTSLTPARIQDSRPSGPQVGPYSTPWGAQTTRDVQVTGLGNVPAGASAAVLNVTVTNTTAPGFLSIWPTGQAQPNVSSLNWVAGQTIPNAVTVKLGPDGKINVFNPGGNVDVIIDVVGYFQNGTGLKFHPLGPARIEDSRPGGVGVSGAWGPGGTKDVTVAGTTVVPTNGVPANADAVLMNVTITSPSTSSFLTIWPAGAAKPLASSLNWVAGLTIPNAVTVKVGTGGANAQKASFFNAGGTVHVIADVGGYYL